MRGQGESTERMAYVLPAKSIDFRPEGPGFAESALHTLLGLVLVLGGALVALWFVRRKGWLNRWVSPLAPVVQPTLAIEAKIRVSPRTMLYRVRDANGFYLLVESSANTTLHSCSPSERITHV